MGRHTHPILLAIYADATQLSSFGNSKIWTFYISLANPPCRIRNSRGKGGPALGGFLPEVRSHLGFKECFSSWTTGRCTTWGSCRWPRKPPLSCLSWLLACHPLFNWNCRPYWSCVSVRENKINSWHTTSGDEKCWLWRRVRLFWLLLFILYSNKPFY
jgi:hypothetical protein